MRGGPSVFNNSSHWEYACYFWESGMQSNALGPLFHSEINKVHGIRRRLPPCTTPSEILISLVNTQVLICIEHFQDGYSSTFQISCLRPVFLQGSAQKGGSAASSHLDLDRSPSVVTRTSRSRLCTRTLHNLRSCRHLTQPVARCCPL